MLKADHRAVEALFADYEGADAERRRKIIQRTTQALILHTILEEEIFYPACREQFADGDPLDEAQVEHDSVKISISELMHGDSSDPYRDAKFRVLAEQVRHHVREEEKAGGTLEKAQARGIDTPDLARELRQRRGQLEADQPLPDPVPRSLGRFAGRRARIDEPRHAGREEQGRGQSRYFEEKDMASYQQYRDRDDRERDERGRFTSQDDDERGPSRYGSRRSSNERPRDEEGRFMSEGRSSGRDYEDSGRYGRRGGQAMRREDDEDRRDGGRAHGGWFGDPEGHSEASRRGWEHRH